MNRITVILLAALDAVITLGVGLAIPLVPLTVLWGLHFDVTAGWLPYWRGAGDIWLLGHGVDVTATLDASTAAQFGLTAPTVFTVTIAALGIALLTAALGSRTGRRAWATPHPFIAAVAGIVTFAVLSALVTLSAHTGAIVPSLLQGSLLPAGVFALGIGVGLAAAETQDRMDAPRGDRNATGRALTGGALTGRALTGRALADHARDSRGRDAFGNDDRALPWRLAQWSPATRAVWAAGVRGGVAASALVIAAAGVFFAVLLAVHYGSVVALYERLQPGILGAIALTFVQAAFLPNAVVWTASWLIGPGFSLGTGTSVDVTQTTLGPLPSVPLFGALPQNDPAFGVIAVLVPVLCGAAAGFLTRARLERMPAPRPTHGSASYASSSGGWGAGRLSLVVLVTAVTAAGILGLLAWWSSGSIGPGRLQEAGPNGLLVVGFAAAEVLVGAAIGVAVRRDPVDADARLSLRERRAASHASGRTPEHVPGFTPEHVPGRSSAKAAATASIASMVSAASARAASRRSEAGDAFGDGDDDFDDDDLDDGFGGIGVGGGNRIGRAAADTASVTEPIPLASLIEARTRPADDRGAAAGSSDDGAADDASDDDPA